MPDTRFDRPDPAVERLLDGDRFLREDDFIVLRGGLPPPWAVVPSEEGLRYVNISYMERAAQQRRYAQSPLVRLLQQRAEELGFNYAELIHAATGKRLDEISGNLVVSTRDDLARIAKAFQLPTEALLHARNITKNG